MTIDDIIDQVAALDGVLVLRPQPGDGSPQISWGDVFFYFAPTGEVPRTQPFATIVTKDYPDEPVSGLSGPGRSGSTSACRHRRQLRSPPRSSPTRVRPMPGSRTRCTAGPAGSRWSTRPSGPRRRQ